MDIRASGERSSKMEAAMTKVFAVAVSILTTSLGAVALSFKTIDVEAGALSANGTFAQSINDRGDVAGFTFGEDGKGHPYLVRHGVVTFLEFPITWGAVEAAARSINSSGDIVGQLSLADGGWHGFLRDHHGKWRSFDVPGAEGATHAFGINGQGEIVGLYSSDGWATDHGFLFRPGHDGAHGSYLSFDYPGAIVTEAYGINDDGDVVGLYAIEPGILHGFLQHEGDFTSVDVPGAQGTFAFGINSRGEIVGQFWYADGVARSFLLSKGTYTTIDVPGAVWSEARSINDHGEIVGNYYDEAGMAHGFEAVRAHR
jgi:uncharacterized membrane protein